MHLYVPLPGFVQGVNTSKRRCYVNEQIELSKRALVTEFDRLEARAAFLARRRAEATKKLGEVARERVRRHLAVLDWGAEASA
jgi:hypothetical protein